MTQLRKAPRKAAVRSDFGKLQGAKVNLIFRTRTDQISPFRPIAWLRSPNDCHWSGSPTPKKTDTDYVVTFQTYEAFRDAVERRKQY